MASRRNRARSSSSRPVRSRSLTTMRPVVGRSRPAMRPSNVDLPLPEGPAMAANWRAGISRVTSVRTSTGRPPLSRRMPRLRTLIITRSILHGGEGRRLARALTGDGSCPRMASLMQPPITWPPGVKSAVCITFDLDAETAWISRDPANIDRISVMSQGAYGPKVGVPLILDFLDRNRLTSTFFVPGWTAERWSDVVAEIHRRGHEIGHHGCAAARLSRAALRGHGGDGRSSRHARLPVCEQPPGLPVAVSPCRHAVARRAARFVDPRRRPILRFRPAAESLSPDLPAVGSALRVARQVPGDPRGGWPDDAHPASAVHGA